MRNCPRCQGKLDYDILVGNYHCNCGWYPEGDDEDYINCTEGDFV